MGNQCQCKIIATFSSGVQEKQALAQETKLQKFQHVARAQTLGYRSDVKKSLDLLQILCEV